MSITLKRTLVRKSAKNYPNVCHILLRVLCETFANGFSIVKEKYGSDVDENDVGSAEEDSEDTTEDEDGEELTPAVDAAILRTLARIKRKDPGIYDVNKDVFEGALICLHLSLVVVGEKY